MLTSLKRYGLHFAPITPLFALTKRDRCFGAFAMCPFLRDSFCGGLVYISQGVTLGSASLKTSHLRHPGGHAKASPVRKRVRALRYIVQIYPNEKNKNGKKKKFALQAHLVISLSGFYTFPTRSTFVAYPCSTIKGLWCLLACGACRPLALP